MAAVADILCSPWSALLSLVSSGFVVRSALGCREFSVLSYVVLQFSISFRNKTPVLKEMADDF